MPTHLYRCSECAYTRDENRKFENIDEVKPCPRCKRGSLVRQFTPPLGLIRQYSADLPAGNTATQLSWIHGVTPPSRRSIIGDIAIINCSTGILIDGPGLTSIDSVDITDTPVGIELRNGAKIEVTNLKHQRTEKKDTGSRKKRGRKRPST